MINNYETQSWHTALGELQLAMNCTFHRVTGISPLALITRRQHCVPPDLLNLVDIDSETVDIEAIAKHAYQRMSQSAEKDCLYTFQPTQSQD